MTELHAQRPLSRVELVVLGRLTAARGATELEIVEALRELGMPLADSALTDCVIATLASLIARALVTAPAKPSTRPRKTKKPAPAPRFTLTEAGRDALREMFGGKAKLTWKDMSGRIIPTLALGEQPGSAVAARALASPEATIAHMLQRDRALGELTTVAQLCDRIIARALGMPPGPVTPDGIRAYALAMHCGTGNKAELEDIATRFAPAKAAKKTKLTKHDRELQALAARLADKQMGVEGKTKAAIVRSLQRRWVSKQDEADEAQQLSALRAVPLQPSHPEASRDPSSGRPPEALLLAVREAIPRVGSDGRYGKENVFVSALWRQIARDRRLPALSLEGFKRWLVTANRNQLLALARADLVDDMDARMVEDSEIEDLGATFHFVLDRLEPPSTPGQVHHGR
jgi:hypothetical protein